jgi:N-acetylmuramoyl-L-alanine amidase
MRLLGYSTKMIRTTDTSIYTEGKTIAAQKVSDLKERVRIVNETENAILISIHQNTFPDGRYSGAQVFYAEDPLSREKAQKLQDALITYLNPGGNRRCKSSEGIYLMQHIQKPGVLIECGFLTNSEEERLLRSQAYQKKLACVIAVGMI